MTVLYEELNKIWFKPKPPEPKKLTIYDILAKRKALELLANINGYKVKYPVEWFSAHDVSDRYWHKNSKRNGEINRKIDCLYKQAQIKNFFPKLTRPVLNKMLHDFTTQTITKNDKRDERIKLVNLRYQRLLPLSSEKYDEFSKKSEKCQQCVMAIKQIHRVYYAMVSTHYFSDKTYKTLHDLDERPYKKPTVEELKYA